MIIKHRIIHCIIILLVTIINISCNIKPMHNSQKMDSCLLFEGKPVLGMGSDLENLPKSFSYLPDERIEHAPFKEAIADYGSTHNFYTSRTSNGVLIGAVLFSSLKENGRIFKVYAWWMLMTEDVEKNRAEALSLIHEKYLPCLEPNKFDLKNGNTIQRKHEHSTETFELTPRIGKDGTDLTYWSFSYKHELNL